MPVNSNRQYTGPNYSGYHENCDRWIADDRRELERYNDCSLTEVEGKALLLVRTIVNKDSQVVAPTLETTVYMSLTFEEWRELAVLIEKSYCIIRGCASIAYRFSFNDDTQGYSIEFDKLLVSKIDDMCYGQEDRILTGKFHNVEEYRISTDKKFKDKPKLVNYQSGMLESFEASTDEGVALIKELMFLQDIRRVNLNKLCAHRLKAQRNVQKVMMNFFGYGAS